MAKGVRLTPEETVRKILAQQKEQVKKIQAKSREKLRVAKARIAEEKHARQTKAADEIEVIYRANPTALDLEKIKAVCAKYWPIAEEASLQKKAISGK